MILRPLAPPPELRRAVYDGAVFLLPPSPASLSLAHEVWSLLVSEFGATPEQLRTAHARFSPRDWFARLAPVRAALAASAPLHALAADVLHCAGLAPDELALDALRLRAVLHDGHREPAAAPAYAAHRDTWYANPRAQLNFWIALHDATEEETFRFFPDRFRRPVANDSHRFDHDAWVARVGWQRAEPPADAAYPQARENLSGERALDVACARGEVLVFSAAHLHQTRANASGRTRFSVDFRAVHLGDHAAGLGAPDVDGRAKGCALDRYARLARP